LTADQTLRQDDGNRYPDLLLSSDDNTATILQNWEFKFPDTRIDNEVFFQDAVRKSKVLGTRSFVVSNLQETRLFVRQDNGECRVKETASFPTTLDRDLVQRNVSAINEHLYDFIARIDLLFRRHELAAPSAPAQYIPTLITAFIDECRDGYASYIERERRADAALAQRIDDWWVFAEHEYRDRASTDAYASQVAFQLASTIFFLHCVAQPASIRGHLAKFGNNPTVQRLSRLCKTATHAVDFDNVLGATHMFANLSDAMLRRAANLSKFLESMCIADIPRAKLRDPVSAILTRDNRRIIGHFCTPHSMACFLAALAAPQKTDTVLDPCCGSGTIFEAFRQELLHQGATAARIAKQAWAGDKFSLPVYMTTLRAADPEHFDTPLRVIQSDCLDLVVGKRFRFHKPGATTVVATLPKVDCIATNLPFVRFEKKSLSALAGSSSAEAIAHISAAHDELGNRIDAYAVLLFHLYKLMSDEGRLVVLTSNSWLGVQWGQKYREKLQSHFAIDAVIMESGPRWFADADVKCTILVLRKRTARAVKDSVLFARPREAFDQSPVEFVRDLASDLHNPKPKFFHVGRYSHADLDGLADVGITWRTAFYGTKWVRSVAAVTVPASDVFPKIERGLRGGNNAFFYPADPTGIESRYLRPLIKDNAGHRMVVRPTRYAFVCKKTLRYLRAHGHHGALRWIHQHEADREKTEGRGVPWYYLGQVTDTQFVTTLNPSDTLLFGAPTRKCVVDQRMILFGGAVIDGTLAQALLNSVISLLWLEQLGFARGLGALDLNATSVKQHLRVPNPSAISASARRQICDRFRALRRRRVRPLPEELVLPDREAFDSAVLSALGISGLHDKLRDVLIAMVSDRVQPQGG